MKSPRNETELVEQLIDVGRRAADQRLISASGGNLSARMPGSDRFFITGTETWLGELQTEDFTVMNVTGTIVAGNPRPSSEYKLHLFTYRERPDTNSIVHLHPQTVVFVDAIGEEIKPLTLDHAAYLRTIRRIGFYPNASDELGLEAAAASRDSNAIVMANHGCSCLGDCLGMAYRRAMNLEEAANATLRAVLLGHRGLQFPPDQVPPLEEGAV